MRWATSSRTAPRRPNSATAAEALATPCDVLVEYTKPESAKGNVLAALEPGAHVVVGTSGLTDGDFTEIDAAARRKERGVLACGNFALDRRPTAEVSPRGGHASFRSGRSSTTPTTLRTTRRAGPPASSLTASRRCAPRAHRARRRTVGPRESRGATVSGSQIHSIRLPGYVISAEVVFGLPDQRLSIRHDSGNSARPYADGALLAIRKVSTLVGLHRGLDAVLEL